MVLIVAGLTAACVVLLLMASLAPRVREVYVRDSVWARLWSRGPWKAEPVTVPPGAPDLLRRFVRSFSPHEAPVETVAEVRFSVLGDGLPGAGPTGTYLAVLAFPGGAVLRWRAQWAAVPRSGFTFRDDSQVVTRGWAFGVVPTIWRTTAAADAEAVDTTLLYIALVACWTPAAIVRNGDARWSADEPALLSAAFAGLPGEPVVSIRVSPDGRPAELSVTARKGSERATLSITMSDFAEFDGYRLPRRLESSRSEGVDRGFVIRLESLNYSGPWLGRHRK